MVYIEPAYAKLNLTLDILGGRSDGYHELRMVMQSVSLRDVVTAEEGAQPGLRIRTNVRYLPTGENNLAVKAACRFFEEVDRPSPGIVFGLEKGIPVCAGMGGGSSDGAAVLRMMRGAYAPEMSIEELERIGAKVGSDVPFCVRGGTALAEGRGEKLTVLPPMPACYIVVCKPGFSISTPELFSLAHGKRLKCHPDTAGLVAALGEGDLEGIAVRLYNVFEEVLPRRYAQVYELKSWLLELGAMAATMTGSGPTVFGLFRDQASAQDAVEAMTGKNVMVWLCSPVRSEDIIRPAV